MDKQSSSPDPKGCRTKGDEKETASKIAQKKGREATRQASYRVPVNGAAMESCRCNRQGMDMKLLSGSEIGVQAVTASS